MITWVKDYIVLFLAFTLVLYLLPSQEYRGYIRFFLELVLVLFCLLPLLGIRDKEFQVRWDETYQSFYEQMEQRHQEAESMEFLNQEYLDAITEGQEE
ncbi:MAG: stage III sporulation protein AF [Lachnospiraceae bacterium]|nr:stage III sporulation protein AF [bacterium]MDY5518053.1 stage III sporulation protein AF [Lachnospiraceae bacterium]